MLNCQLFMLLAIRILHYTFFAVVVRYFKADSIIFESNYMTAYWP